MSEPRDYTGGPDAFPIDIGYGLRMRECEQGYEVRHLCRTGQGDRPTDRDIWNAPVVDTANPGHHTLVSRDPLELTPSLQCPTCGLHGFVRGGRWVPAGCTNRHHGQEA